MFTLVYLLFIDFVSLFCFFCFFFFFFKQKTAYEMRISDWSSDVCSSDLAAGPARSSTAPLPRTTVTAYSRHADTQDRPYGPPDPARSRGRSSRSHHAGGRPPRRGDDRDDGGRSEERRVGKAYDNTCRSGLHPAH